MRQRAIGLVGVGAWGRNHARVLSRLGHLGAVADADPESARAVGGQYGAPASNFDALLADPAIAAVVIASPAATHATLARAALSAGKDVLVEKPLALDTGDATQLVRLAADRGCVLMVGHILQYHPAFVRLKAMVSAGELGTLKYVGSHRMSLGRIRREENILWSFAPHDISMILALAGGAPARVEAVGYSYLNEPIADFTTTHLEFVNGIRADIFVSWLYPFKEQRLVVVGERAMAVFDDTRPWPEKLMVFPGAIDWRAGVVASQRGPATAVALTEGEPLQAELEHFAAMCATRGRPLTDGEEGVRVLAVLRAAQASMDARVSAGRSPPSSAGHFVHETAVVDPDVTIGDKARIWHFTHVLSGSRIGAGCVIGQNCMIGPDVSIGRGCKIQNNVSLYKGVMLEDEVFCGPSCVFTNVLTPRAHVERKDEFAATHVGRGATIGANATIVCGVRIGAFAMIGAGAVVTRDVPAHALVVGNPARRLGWVSETGERLGDDLVCPRTGQRYQLLDGGLRRAPAEARVERQ
jgi:predicted dehydrogenase/acetyltransferase-like isoleucine patch superfamily enzyme